MSFVFLRLVFFINYYRSNSQCFLTDNVFFKKKFVDNFFLKKKYKKNIWNIFLYFYKYFKIASVIWEIFIFNSLQSSSMLPC